MKQPPRSALVDLVMKDATEEEKAEAIRNWFGFLELLLHMVDEAEHRQTTDSRESGESDRFVA